MPTVVQVTTRTMLLRQDPIGKWMQLQPTRHPVEAALLVGEQSSFAHSKITKVKIYPFAAGLIGDPNFSSHLDFKLCCNRCSKFLGIS